MPNPIFNALGGGNSMLGQFQRFMEAMRGRDPQKILNELISSGKVNQAQLNQAQQMAQQMGGALEQFKGMFGF